MGAGDEARGAVAAGAARAGDEEADAEVSADVVGGDGGVVDVADDVVAVEGLRGGAGADFEDGGVV